jgi:8-oxo-dGTP pyrophosphatase MutT (NUDIX family)
VTPGGTPEPGLAERLARHRPRDAREAADLARILAFVRRHPDPFDRRIAEGHLTGSALVLSVSGDRVLLLHHRKLGRWLQPGGHADPGERTGEVVALREAREETGLAGLALHPTAPRPLDVDVHDIPARPGEPAHQHLDLRYLVIAPDGQALRPAAGEARALRWFGWDELGALDLDAGLRRALATARALVTVGAP